VALSAAVALILPSVVLQPAAILHVESGAEHSHHDHHHHASEHAGADGNASRHAHVALSDIPGSPTHPVNHDCPECQVIKYLATSCLPQASAPLLPSQHNDAPPSDRCHQPREIGRVAVLPPIRAPPLLPA
jgi:hypothetical protein